MNQTIPMKMKPAQASAMLSSMQSLSDKALPVKLCYAISRNADLLQRRLEELDQERVKLCERYAAKDPDGNPVLHKNDDGNAYYEIADKEAFQGEVEQLNDIDLDVQLYYLYEGVLEQCDNERYDPLTPAQLQTIGKFIMRSET